MSEAVTAVHGQASMLMVCRICITRTSVDCSIYEAPKRNNGSMSLHAMLVELFPKVFNATQVQRDADVSWPSRICLDCKGKVMKAYRLYELCVRSAERLQMLSVKEEQSSVPNTLQTTPTFQSVRFLKLDFLKCDEPKLLEMKCNVPCGTEDNRMAGRSAAYRRFYGTLSTTDAFDGTSDQQYETCDNIGTEAGNVSSTLKNVSINSSHNEADSTANQLYLSDDLPSPSGRSLQQPFNRVEKSKNKMTTYAQRKRVILHSNKGISSDEIAKMLNLSRHSVNCIVKKYRTTGMVTARPHGGERKPKLTPTMVDLVKSWLDEDCTLTLRAICSKVQECFGLVVSPATVSRCIDGFYFGFTRVQIPTNINTAEVLLARKDYSTELTALKELIPASAIVYFHGADLSVYTRLADPADNSAYRRAQSKPLSVLCAINSEGVLHYSASERAMGTESVLTFIDGLKMNLVRKNIHHAVLVMDPARYHHNEEVQNAVEGETTALLCVPPHSPRLNPLETIFSSWTDFIKRANPKSEQQLTEAVKNGASLITPEDCEQCVRDAWNYSTRCMEEETLH